MAFTNEQMERYSRHIILQEVGVKGQKKLLNGKVLIIGAGGLGAPAAMYPVSYTHLDVYKRQGCRRNHYYQSWND